MFWEEQTRQVKHLRPTVPSSYGKNHAQRSANSHVVVGVLKLVCLCTNSVKPDIKRKGNIFENIGGGT